MPLRDIDLFVPDWSHGLKVDGGILRGELQALGVAVNVALLPPHIYQSDAATNEHHYQLNPKGDTALFGERLFDHPALAGYRRRICLPHPEWFEPRDASRIHLITECWHKSRAGMAIFSERFPDIEHRYLGFTSVDPGLRVDDHRHFGHFQGKAPFRSSQAILDSWLKHPEWPLLKMQAYGAAPFPNIREWIQHRNMAFHFGFLSADQYRLHSASTGIHLCTSEVEGFGHYINEARALGALVVTVDGAPMTELIDDDCGLLVPSHGTSPQNLGIRYRTTEASITRAIETVLGMDDAHRQRLGQRARQRFEDDRRAFRGRLAALVAE